MSVRTRNMVKSCAGKATFSYSARYSPNSIYSSQSACTVSSITDHYAEGRRSHPCDHVKYPIAVLQPSLRLEADWSGQQSEWYRVTYGFPTHMSVEVKSDPLWSPGSSLRVTSIPSNPAAPTQAPWNDLVAELGLSVDKLWQSKTNIIENLATAGQTLAMVKQPLAGLRKIVKAAKAGKMSLAALRDVSGSWMEYRYGWNPLRYSIKAFSEAISKVDDHIKYLKSIRGRNVSVASRKSYTYNYPPSSKRSEWASNVPSSSSTLSTVLEPVQRKTTYCISCDKLVPASLAIASKAYYMAEYLNATSLFSALWELLPCSFVIDWLINVDLLLASSQVYRFQRPDISELCHSSREEYKFRYLSQAGIGSVPGGLYGPWTLTPRFYESEDFKAVTYHRYVDLPSGSDAVGFFGGMNLVHSADATALFILSHK